MINMAHPNKYQTIDDLIEKWDRSVHLATVRYEGIHGPLMEHIRMKDVDGFSVPSQGHGTFFNLLKDLWNSFKEKHGELIKKFLDEMHPSNNPDPKQPSNKKHGGIVVYKQHNMHHGRKRFM